MSSAGWNLVSDFFSVQPYLFWLETGHSNMVSFFHSHSKFFIVWKDKSSQLCILSSVPKITQVNLNHLYNNYKLLLMPVLDTETCTKKSLACIGTTSWSVTPDWFADWSEVLIWAFMFRRCNTLLLLFLQINLCPDHILSQQRTLSIRWGWSVELFVTTNYPKV